MQSIIVSTLEHTKPNSNKMKECDLNTVKKSKHEIVHLVEYN